MKSKRNIVKIFTVILVVFLSLSLFANNIAFVESIHHDCTGEDCAVCLYINACHNILKAIFLAVFGTALLSVILAKIKTFMKNTGVSVLSNPVFAKVKLSN